MEDRIFKIAHPIELCVLNILKEPNLDRLKILCLFLSEIEVGCKKVHVFAYSMLMGNGGG